ncbi:MAG: HAD family hydrolase [Planctomycetota bacterium]
MTVSPGAREPAPLRGTPELVCFDLGGVIVRICRSWEEGCRLVGLPVREGFRPGATVIDRLVDAHQTGAIDVDEYAGRMSDAFAGLYTAEEIVRIHAAWVLGPYEGLETVIDGLHDRGVVTAALSNTNAHHWAELPAVPPIARLRHRLASHELGLRKPDLAIYREAERRLGFAGDQILFFDDLPENVEAARAVGWRAVLVDPARETAPQIAAALREHGL